MVAHVVVVNGSAAVDGFVSVVVDITVGDVVAVVIALVSVVAVCCSCCCCVLFLLLLLFL